MTAMFRPDAEAANRNVTNQRHNDTSSMLDGSSVYLPWLPPALPTVARRAEVAGGRTLAVMNGGFVVMNGESGTISERRRLDRRPQCL